MRFNNREETIVFINIVITDKAGKQHRSKIGAKFVGAMATALKSADVNDLMKQQKIALEVHEYIESNEAIEL